MILLDKLEKELNISITNWPKNIYEFCDFCVDNKLEPGIVIGSKLVDKGLLNFAHLFGKREPPKGIDKCIILCTKSYRPIMIEKIGDSIRIQSHDKTWITSPNQILQVFKEANVTIAEKILAFKKKT